MSSRLPLSKGLDAVAGLLLNLVDKALEKSTNLKSDDRLLLPCLKRWIDRGLIVTMCQSYQWDRRLIAVT
jgi:hypothetical protein